ncbi:MAG: RNA polymerase subunit sigma-24 [Verrucomicrobia bacterium]|nr:RNA polymerase subunit sigma-24 [Verrucomicrobiota bacterium]
MEITDRELLERYAKGDVDALGRLVERHRRGLYGFVVNMTRNTAEADDVFQDVWVKVIRRMETYTEQNFGGWLLKIARNVVIDRSRKRKPDISLDAETEEGGSMMQTLKAKDPDPTQGLDAGHLGKRIALAVEKLPDEQKEVFVMRVQSDLSFKEIAEIQGVSINTALARMQYALAKLRAILGNEYKALISQS